MAVTATATMTVGAASAQARAVTHVGADSPIPVSARVVRYFSNADQSRRVFGQLRFRGGLVLRSPDRAFGGISGLQLDAAGRSFLAVTDAGSWVRGRLHYRGGQLSGMSNTWIGAIRALGNKVLKRGRDRDAEALRLVKGDLTRGVVLIGFERNQRIGFFPIAKSRLSGPTTYLRPPRRLARNKGIEAVAVLAVKPYAGAPIAFAERSLDPNGHHRGWIWVKGRPRPIALTNLEGFDITDCAVVANGDLIILERRFRWSEGVQMRLRLVKSMHIKPGAVLNGQVLLKANLSAQIDNMEGLSVHRNARGQTILTLISDDNFNRFLQRTIMLQFELLR